VQLDFIKMEGAGNDYVYLDCLKTPAPSLSPAQIARISDRHFGIGSDGVVMILPSDTADAFMRMWNSDGSESAMCGNALRCVAFYTGQQLGQDSLSIETLSGVHPAQILEKSAGGSKDPVILQGFVSVSIGKPRLEAAEIPFLPGAGMAGAGPLVDVSLGTIPGIPGEVRATLVSMGNPHCVVFVPEPDAIDISLSGPALETHPAFPEKTNVEFVSILPDGSIKQRTWERGSGETLACGSGVCAVLVASVLARNLPRKNTIHVRGGDLRAEWADEVVLFGPARIVYKGRITV
jgi:diaminopimelate epimerase